MQPQLQPRPELNPPIARMKLANMVRAARRTRLCVLCAHYVQFQGAKPEPLTVHPDIDLGQVGGVGAEMDGGHAGQRDDPPLEAQAQAAPCGEAGRSI